MQTHKTDTEMQRNYYRSGQKMDLPRKRIQIPNTRHKTLLHRKNCTSGQNRKSDLQRNRIQKPITSGSPKTQMQRKNRTSGKNI